MGYKHGETGTRLYYIWSGMRKRVLNSNNPAYKNYGSRGITICDEWLKKEKGYINFRDWAIQNGYAENLEINRIWNAGNYEPSNCNFVPAKENSRNRRGQKIKNIEIANEIRDLHKSGNYTQKELTEKYNVCSATISNIINNKRWIK